MSSLDEDPEGYEALRQTIRRLIRDVSEMWKLPEDRVIEILARTLDDEKLTKQEKEIAVSLGLGLREAARQTGDVRTFSYLESQEAAEAEGLTSLVSKLAGDSARAAAQGRLEIDWVVETLQGLSIDKSKHFTLWHFCS